MHSGKIDEKLYPYFKDKPKVSTRSAEFSAMQNKSRAGASKKNSAFEKAHNPRLFTFVIGGMSHHEVVSISNLQEELPA